MTKKSLLIAIGSALVNNVVLSQFLGLCPFLWSFQKGRDFRRNGRSRYFRYYTGLYCNQPDLQLCAGTFKTGISADDRVYSGNRSRRFSLWRCS